MQFKAPKPSDKKPKTQRKLLSKTKTYLLEFSVQNVVALILGITAINLIWVIFSVISGSASAADQTGSLAWSFSLFTSLGPLFTVLYARTSGEEALHSVRFQQVARNVLFYGMLSVSLVTSLVLTIIAGYTLSRLLFGFESSKILISATFPALTTLLLAAYFSKFILARRPISAYHRRVNLIVVPCLLILAIGASLTMGLLSRDTLSKDRQTVQDLSSVALQINRYSRQNKLPNSIEDVPNIGESVRTKFSNGTYAYKPGFDVESPGYPKSEEGFAPYPNDSTSGYYELCATFKTLSPSLGGGYYEPADAGSSTSESREKRDILSSLEYHDKGYACIKMYNSETY